MKVPYESLENELQRAVTFAARVKQQRMARENPQFAKIALSEENLKTRITTIFGERDVKQVRCDYKRPVIRP